jgi:hypothetical protein
MFGKAVEAEAKRRRAADDNYKALEVALKKKLNSTSECRRCWTMRS